VLRNPTETDVRELFLSSGVRFSDKGDYFSILCPFHTNTKTAAAVLYKDKWLFKCFGCNTVYSFPKLYEALKGKPWEEHSEFSMVPTPQKVTMTNGQREAYAIVEGRVTSVYDNVKALIYCRERGVSDDFMQFFDFQASDLCRFANKENEPVVIWKDRLLVPITLNGKPYSLEGRDYTRKQIPKCLYPKHCKTDICFNQDNLDKTKPLVVCEGIMDIHKIWSNIGKNVTCTFGASISDKQKTYLRNVSNLILFIDDDLAGHISVSTFEKFMEFDFKVAKVSGKDPGDASLDELSAAIDNATNWVDFLMEETRLFERSVQFSLGKV